MEFDTFSVKKKFVLEFEEVPRALCSSSETVVFLPWFHYGKCSSSGDFSGGGEAKLRVWVSDGRFEVDFLAQTLVYRHEPSDVDATWTQAVDAALDSRLHGRRALNQRPQKVLHTLVVEIERVEETYSAASETA